MLNFPHALPPYPSSQPWFHKSAELCTPQPASKNNHTMIKRLKVKPQMHELILPSKSYKIPAGKQKDFTSNRNLSRGVGILLSDLYYTPRSTYTGQVYLATKGTSYIHTTGDIKQPKSSYTHRETIPLVPLLCIFSFYSEGQSKIVGHKAQNFQSKSLAAKIKETILTMMPHQILIKSSHNGDGCEETLMPEGFGSINGSKPNSIYQSHNFYLVIM